MPTHFDMKYLFMYPQTAYPYANLVETNRHRSRLEHEYEILDSGGFDGDCYFDVVEYAMAGPEDALICITVGSRGSDAALLHLLPTLWFRNTWSWPDGGPKPMLQVVEAMGYHAIQAHHTDQLFQESDAEQRAFCYVRVIQIPTARWTAYDQDRFGIKMSDYVPTTVTDRACIAPIWYAL
jgi:uncharacterized protein DUF3604